MVILSVLHISANWSVDACHGKSRTPIADALSYIAPCEALLPEFWRISLPAATLAIFAGRIVNHRLHAPVQRSFPELASAAKSDSRSALLFQAAFALRSSATSNLLVNK